jgi:hypothetical protein
MATWTKGTKSGKPPRRNPPAPKNSAPAPCRVSGRLRAARIAGLRSPWQLVQPVNVPGVRPICIPANCVRTLTLRRGMNVSKPCQSELPAKISGTSVRSSNPKEPSNARRVPPSNPRQSQRLKQRLKMLKMPGRRLMHCLKSRFFGRVNSKIHDTVDTVERQSSGSEPHKRALNQ